MPVHSHFLRLLPLILLTGFLWKPAPAARAQNVGDAVVSAALGVPADPETKAPPAVYLTWWPTGTSTWTPRTYAIYSKDGAPDDPGLFTLAGLVQPQVDPVAVRFSLNQSLRVGQDLDALSRGIDGLYDKIVPVGGMTLEDKLAAIIAVSELDPESAETLSLLTRSHPAAALAAGVAFIDTIPEGQTRTYEIRTCPDGTTNAADCDVVSGRLVVTGGEVRHLPAPGQPVHVPFVGENGLPDPRGNLNVPLRWATPDSLREQSFFQFGFDVYRATVELTEARGWHKTPPARADFMDAIETHPTSLRRVNSLPVLTDEQFSLADAADLGADPETFFLIDDNNRYEPGGQPFEDGDSFYYFVTARDLLGRPGDISAGTPVTVCFQIPPEAPTNVIVSNHYSWDAATDTQEQVFKIEWDPAEPRENGPDIAGYWIYRWESIDQMHRMQGLPSSTLPAGSLTGGRIATVPAGTTEYIDNVGPHPFIRYSRQGDLETPAVIEDAAAGKTYWYTVRAIDDSFCSANVSGNSAPAYGVLRDRIGPAAPDGSLAGNCVNFLVDLQRAYVINNPELTAPNVTYLRLSMERFDPRIAWVEYYIGPMVNERSFLGRFYFDETKQQILVHTEALNTQWLRQFDFDQGQILARVGTADGQASGFANSTFVSAPPPNPKAGAYVQVSEFTALATKDPDCAIHVPEIADGSETVVPVGLTLDLTPGTEEWKVYRQVDDGPLTLLRQGLGSYDDTPQVSLEDVDLPLNGGRICYYLQVFDRHGNPSVLQRIGCIVSEPRTALPQPMLSALQPIGETPETGGARINWFSPPAGVDRFELWIHAEAGLTGATLSDDLRLNIPPPPDGLPILSLRYDAANGRNYRAYVTGRVGANFDAGPDFVVDWTENFSAGTEYFIRVRAIGAGGATGPWSNEESFVWSPEIDFSQPFDPSDCVVPWPVRGLPMVKGEFPVTVPDGTFEVGLEAAINPRNPDGTTAYAGGAVRVGFVTLGQLDVTVPKYWNMMPKGTPEQGIFQLPLGGLRLGENNLSEAFYQQTDGTSLLNFMLFRYQVPSLSWPTVSGDVYQVSPLIEGMANSTIQLNGEFATAVHDPYFFLIEVPGGADARAFHLYVKDTQPVIQGASYRYLVARFDDAGEIVQVIPLATVTAN